MNCETCKDHNKGPVPYIVHEEAEARAERHIKRMVIALVITVFLMFATNGLWLWAWMQYDCTTETEEYTVDLDAGYGNANYIGQDGDIYNGASASD